MRWTSTYIQRRLACFTYVLRLTSYEMRNRPVGSNHSDRWHYLAVLQAQWNWHRHPLVTKSPTSTNLFHWPNTSSNSYRSVPTVQNSITTRLSKIVAQSLDLWSLRLLVYFYKSLKIEDVPFEITLLCFVFTKASKENPWATLQSSITVALLFEYRVTR